MRLSTIENAVEAMKLGAYDYLVKPINFRHLKNILSRVTPPAELRPARHAAHDSTWAADDGSLLLWNLILAGYVAAVAVRFRRESGFDSLQERQRLRGALGVDVRVPARARRAALLDVRAEIVAAPGTQAETCNECSGRGQLRYQQGFFTVARTCNQCRGSGSIVSAVQGECPSVVAR